MWSLRQREKNDCHLKLSKSYPLFSYNEYIYIRDILTNILTQNIGNIKINENYENIRKKTLKNYIKNKNRHFNFF